MASVIVQNVHENPDLSGMLDALGISGSGTLIKPNWSTPDPGFYSDAEGMDTLLSAIPGKKYVIESYMYGRTTDHKRITPDNGKEHWEWFREQEADFLQQTGIAAVLRKHEAESINITEEYWSGRTVDPETIRELVETQFPPVKALELYGMIPSKLYALRHLPMISFAKIKYQVPNVGRYSTFSLKNLFGLIPVPNRHYYHDIGLPQSIMDIAKIYKSLFGIVGIVDASRHIAVYREPGKNKYKMIFTEYDLIENTGLLLAGKDLVTLEAYINRMIGQEPELHEVLSLAKETFGNWDEKEIDCIPDELLAIFRPYLED